MENKIIFLIVVILLVFALFSKTGTAVIKNLIGIAKNPDANTGSAIPNNWGVPTNQAPTSQGGNGNSAGSGTNTSPANGGVMTASSVSRGILA